MSNDLMAPVTTFYRVFNEHDTSLWNEAIAEDYVGHVNGADVPDRDVGKTVVQVVIDAFPDIHFTMDDTIIQGEKVVVRWSATGTHTGDFYGMAPTNRSVRKIGITIFRIKDGKVAELWNIWDLHGLIEQLTAEA